MDENDKDWFKTKPADTTTVVTAIIAVIAVIVFVTLSAIYGDRGRSEAPTKIQAPDSQGA